jgi:hypothetical protein
VLFRDWSGFLQNGEGLFQVRLHLSESEPQFVHFSFGVMGYARETIDFVIHQTEARIHLIKALVNLSLKSVDLLLEGVDSAIDLLIEGADPFKNCFNGGPGGHFVSHL